MKSSEFINDNNEHQSQPTLIGSGGTCDLYRIMIHNKFHVLKKLKPKYINSPQYIESLRREFEIGYQLDHFNIVRYLKYVHNKEEQSILLEFIDGATLAEVINKQAISLTLDQKKALVIQLCNVIEYLHSKQTYHLDLKPENILVTFRGKNIKLIDFGHSLTDGDVSKVGGTIEFMPPEQSLRQFDATNDLYAIGKIIEFLYSNESEKEKSYWYSIIAKCLSKEKGVKYNSIEELKNEVEKPSEQSKHLLIYSIFALLVIISVVFYIIQTNKNQNVAGKQESLIINNPDSLKTNSELSEKDTLTNDNILIETKTINLVDTTYCKELGVSLYDSFVIAYNNSVKTIKSGSVLQTRLTDSIQSLWFDYSSKFEVGSEAYESAYNCYYPGFSDSQQKIMNLLYGSE